jgi:hypothetical protein
LYVLFAGSDRICVLIDDRRLVEKNVGEWVEQATPLLQFRSHGTSGQFTVLESIGRQVPERHRQSVTNCTRCGAMVEPLPSP